MFEEMTEQQAREQILEMTKEYCEKYHNQKKPYEKGDRIPIRSKPALQKAEMEWNMAYQTPLRKPKSRTNTGAMATAPRLSLIHI